MRTLDLDPPILNRYALDHVDVWVKFVEGAGDLDLVEIEGAGGLGDPPEWWTEAVSDMGIDLVLQNYSRYSRTPEGWEVRDGMAVSALELGVAPNQPFLVRVYATEWHTSPSTLDGPGETDGSNDVECVGALPWPAERARAAWARHLREAREFVFTREAERERREVEPQRDAANMAIHASHYWTRGAYDNGPPDGLALQLVRRPRVRRQGAHEHPAWMAQGRSDRGDFEEALRNLAADLVRFPHVPMGLEGLRKLRTFHT